MRVDADLFDRHVVRLTQLGYTTARTQLVWPLGRMLLHRGDPDLTALGVNDLDELRAAIDAFTARLRLDPVREFYSRAPVERPPEVTADGYLRSAIPRLHAVHVLLFDLGQLDRPPTGRVTAGSWVDHLAPPDAPPKIRTVIERYLRLHLDANLDRPQTVRHARDALRRLVTWMTGAHPEMTGLADLRREHAEEFLRWLDTYPDGHPRLRIPVGKGYTERSIPLHPQAADALQPLIEIARQQRGRRRYDPSAGREVQHIFVVRGKLLSKSLLFDMALAEACTAAGLVDSAGKATITAHRFRHTIGTQLAEGGARIQTIMAVLGHRTPNMSIIYASLSDPTVKQQYQDALDRHLGPDVTLAGPAADALREHRLDPEAVSWLQTNFLKTELELGHCLRTPAEGPCECDLVLTCSEFLTTSDYAPRLRDRLEVEQQLIDDATARGWQREIERHQRTADRLTALLQELGHEAGTGPADLTTTAREGANE